MTITNKGYTKKGMTQAVERAQSGALFIYTKKNLNENQILNYELAEKLNFGVTVARHKEKGQESTILMQSGIVLEKYLCLRNKQMPNMKFGFGQFFSFRNEQRSQMNFSLRDEQRFEILSKYILSNQNIIAQLNNIIEVLRKNKIAHTDIKPANIVIVDKINSFDPYFELAQNPFCKGEDKQKGFKARCINRTGRFAGNPRVYLIDCDSMTKYGQIREVGTPGINCQKQKLMKGEIVDQNTDQMGLNFVIDYILKY